MRRIVLLLSVATLMVAMMVASAVPAFALKPPLPPPGKWTCVNGLTGETIQVGRGQLDKYDNNPFYDCTKNV